MHNLVGRRLQSRCARCDLSLTRHRTATLRQLRFLKGTSTRIFPRDKSPTVSIPLGGYLCFPHGACTSRSWKHLAGAGDSDALEVVPSRVRFLRLVGNRYCNPGCKYSFCSIKVFWDRVNRSWPQVGRISLIRAQDGACVIGLHPWASIPLLASTLCSNTFEPRAKGGVVY